MRLAFGVRILSPVNLTHHDWKVQTVLTVDSKTAVVVYDDERRL